MFFTVYAVYAAVILHFKNRTVGIAILSEYQQHLLERIHVI